jgi:TPR repeat protein
MSATTAKTEYRSQNYDRALELLLPIAESGDAEAQCMVGTIYQLGLGSTEPNEAEAQKWYILSSDRGYGVASNNLATLFCQTDRERAMKLYELAREQSFPHSPISVDDLDGFDPG